VVHRWAYDYSVPGVAWDYAPQNMSPEEAGVGDGGASHAQVEATAWIEALRGRAP